MCSIPCKAGLPASILSDHLHTRHHNAEGLFIDQQTSELTLVIAHVGMVYGYLYQNDVGVSSPEK